MKPASFHTRNAHLLPRKFAVTLAAATACILAAGNVAAQVAVIDGTSIATNDAGFAAQLAKTVDQYVMQGQQYVMQGEQYANQLLQYQQLLSSVTGLTSNMSLAPNQLQEISDPGSLIQAKCSTTTGGGMLGSLMNSLTSLITQPAAQSQQQICAQIVTTQVDKYNKTVDMLNRLGQYNTMFQQVEKVAQSISTLADSNRVSNQAQDYDNALKTEMANYQAQMQADDAMIKTLQDQQSLLSQMALNGNGGSSSVLSDALPDTSFQNALGGVQ